MNAVERDRDNYNFEHFRQYILRADAIRTIERHGIDAGETAPDFELPVPTGEFLRLSALRGRPVLLHFGSWT